MNKKILMSVAAAATVATIFSGCGSDDLSSSSSSGFAAKGTLQGTTITIGSASAVTDNNGYYTVTNPTGTTITTGTDGIDAVTGLAPTRSMSSDTTLVDSSGNIIINAITDAAVKSGESNLTSAMTTIATKLGVTLSDVLKPITNSAADATLENSSRLLFNQITQFVADGNASGAFTAISSAQDGNFTSVITAMNAQTNEINTSVTPLANIAALLTSQPAAFAASATDGNISSAKIAANQTLIQNTIVLDENVTTATVTTGVAEMSVLDTNGTVSITSSTDDTNATGELLISLANSATSGANANASYALRLNNLLVTKDTNGYITNLGLNTNTSLVVSANSNMSKVLNLTGDEVNATMLLSSYGLITAAGDNSTNGMDINVTAFTNYVTTVVGTGSDTATNGNYTSGMAASGNFALDVLLNVNDNNVTTSEQVYFGETGNIKVNGTTYVGYKVIDANLTK